MGEEVVWDGERWVRKAEFDEFERIKRAVMKVLEEVEFNVSIDLGSGSGKITVKRAGGGA
jgi:hypothetical protein